MTMAAVSPGPGERTTLARACTQLGFRLGRISLALDIGDHAALQLVQEAYSALLCPPGGARARAAIQRLSDGRLHVRYGRQALGIANAADPVPLRAAYHAAREVFARFACETPNAIALYGTLCEVNHGAVLLLGPTMIGKTLLALHLAAAGARFLGDETVVLSLTAGEAHAMPRRPVLRESALPFLPDAVKQSVGDSKSSFATERGRFWYALDAAALGGIEPSAHAYPVRAICVIRERADEPAIRRLDPAEGAKVLAQRAYVRQSSLAQISALRRATRHAQFFEVTLGAPQDSARALLHEVRGCV